MARNTSKDALLLTDGAQIPVDAEVTPLGDRDSEDAWDSWIEGLRATENSGTIRAYKLSVAEDGTPNYGKGSKHALLGAWPHQMYDLDSLSEKLRKEFMEPGETAWFKINGTTQGRSGTMCSQVIKLIRSRVESTSGPESLTQLFQLMQQGQERQATMLREIIKPDVQVSQQPQGKSLAETAKEFTAILVPVLGPVLAALIARPAKPATDFGAMVDALRSMRGFITGSDEDGGSNDTPTVAIIKSIAPAIPQLLQVLQQRNTPQPARAPQVALAAPGIRQTDVFDTTIRASVPSTSQQPQGNPTASAQPKVSPVDTGDKEMLDILKPQLEQLAEVAASGESAKEAAQLIFNLISAMPQAEKILNSLAGLVESKQRFSGLMILAPKIRAHSIWFEELRVELENLLLEPESEDLTAAE